MLRLVGIPYSPLTISNGCEKLRELPLCEGQWLKSIDPSSEYLRRGKTANQKRVKNQREQNADLFSNTWDHSANIAWIEESPRKSHSEYDERLLLLLLFHTKCWQHGKQLYNFILVISIDVCFSHCYENSAAVKYSLKDTSWKKRVVDENYNCVFFSQFKELHLANGQKS